MYVCTYVYVCAYTYLCTYGKATQPIYVPSLTYLNFHHVNPHPQFTLSTPSYGLSSSMEELVVFPPLNPLTLLPPSPLLPLLPHPQFTSPLTPLPLLSGRNGRVHEYGDSQFGHLFASGAAGGRPFCLGTAGAVLPRRSSAASPGR